jgi:hypothetical protein
MKKSETIKVLRGLESHYAAALGQVRDLIKLEGGESDEDAPKQTASSAGSATGSNGDAATKKDMKKMAKGDAVALLFQESGQKELHKVKMFEEMHRRGHPVSSLASLTSGLSGDARFKSVGAGKWCLAQPDLATTNGANGTH